MFEQDKIDVSLRDDYAKELIEKFLTICLPVKIIPCVEVKPIKAECCGKPIITPRHDYCCKGSENGCCEFTIIQKMKVEIPVEFKTKTDIADPFVDCEFRKDDDKDKDKECDKCKGKDKEKYDDKYYYKDEEKYDDKEHGKDKEKYDDKYHDKDIYKCDDKYDDKDKEKDQYKKY